jgi:hypothetical protein
MKRRPKPRKSDAVVDALEALARGERVGSEPEAEPEPRRSTRGTVNRITRESPRSLHRRPAGA